MESSRPLLRRLTAPIRRHRSLGRWGERLAARYLENDFYVIWKHNWRDKRGEIDLIAIRDRTIVFIEVKSRTAGTSDLLPLDQITELKEKRLRRAVRSFLASHRLDLRRRSIRNYRIDFIGVVTHPRRRRALSLEHIEDIFRVDEDYCADYCSATNTRPTLP